MKTLKTLAAAALLAASSTVAFAQADIDLYEAFRAPVQSQMIEGRNSAPVAGFESHEGIDRYSAFEQGPVFIEGRNSAPVAGFNTAGPPVANN